MGTSYLDARRLLSRWTVRQGKWVTGLKLNGLCHRGPNLEIQISQCRCVARRSSLLTALRHRHPRLDPGILAGDDPPSRHRVPHRAPHHSPGLVRASAAQCRSGRAMSLLMDDRSSARHRAEHRPDGGAICVAVC